VRRGTSLGRYIVLDRIGEGGMGAVYSAYDPDLNRRLAIKVMTVADANGRGRLLREAQAMAKLSHTNVISVFDVGSHDDGVFVAMELIEGTTLREWRAPERSWREILYVYVQAGRGLAAAHQAELVHRDFKPENVLVGKDGRVSVTDFGLVRSGDPSSYDTPAPEEPLRDPSSLEHPIGRVTRDGTVVGTPEYMSPEQHLGQRTDERSDQFSFCVALYEALYGEHPFGQPPASFDAAIAGKVRPPRPGARVPGWVRRALLRGLERRPEDRYPDMRALLHDLAPDRGRRRALGIAVGVAALAVAVTVSAFVRRGPAACTAGSPVWEDSDRVAVAAAFERTGAPHAGDAAGAVSRALDGYARGYATMYGEACKETRVDGVQSAELLDRRMLCLEGRRDAARRLVALFEQADADLVGRAAPAAYALPSLADCADPAALRRPAARNPQIEEKLRQAQTLSAAARYRDALALASDAATAARQEGGPLLAQALLERGRLESLLGEEKAAADTLTLAAAASLAEGDELGAVEAWDRLSTAINRGMGLFDEAERWARVARATIGRTAPGSEREADVLLTLGGLMIDKGRLDEAQAELGRGLAILERQKGPDHPDVAEAVRLLANVASERGQYDQARADYERTERILEQAYGEHHRLYAQAVSDVGRAAFYQGKFKESLELQQRALAILADVLGPDHPEVGRTWAFVAVATENSGDLEGALPAYRKALAIAEMRGPEHPDVAEVLAEMGGVYHKQGHFEQALEMNRRALAIQNKAYGPESRLVGERLMNIGVEEKSLGRYADANRSYARALAIVTKTAGPEHMSVGLTLDNQGEVQRLMGDARGALATYERSVAVLEKALGKDHPYVADPLTGLGRCELALGRAAAALAPLERALAMRAGDGDTDHNLAETRMALAEAIVATGGDRARARTLLEAARKAYASYGDKRKQELVEVEAALAKL
jgi:tetratricopeptide (TPR) repeat protein